MTIIQAIHKMFGVDISTPSKGELEDGRRAWRDAIHDHRNATLSFMGSAKQTHDTSVEVADGIEQTIVLQEHTTGLRRAELDLLALFQRK